MEENTKIIVVSTSPESDTYGHELAQQFARGAKAAGLEVEQLSLYGKTMEQAFELGKRLSPLQAPKPAAASPQKAAAQAPLRADVRVQKMVLAIGTQTLPRRQIVAELGLKQGSRACFINNYLRPTYEQGYIDFAYPASPHKPIQAYRLTAKGLELYQQLTSPAS